jgi:hypothetical protein
MADTMNRLTAYMQENPIDPVSQLSHLGDVYRVVDNEDGTFTIQNRFNPEDTHVWQPGMSLPDHVMKAMIQYLHEQFANPDEVRSYTEDLQNRKTEEEKPKSRTRGSLFEKRRPGWVFGGFEKRGMSNWSPEAAANIFFDAYGNVVPPGTPGAKAYSPSQLSRGQGPAGYVPNAPATPPPAKKPYDLRNQPHYSDYM